MNNEPYRPSNGTEGMYFTDEFCDRCIFEAGDKMCDLLTRSLFWDIGDPDYPSEWVYVNEKPTCTRFIERGDGDEDPQPPIPEDPNQLCLPFVLDEILAGEVNPDREISVSVPETI